jgi:hypothetical protein
MAAVAKSPEIVTNWGNYVPFVTGVATMASGTATIALASKFAVIFGAVGSVVNASTGVGETVTFSVSGTNLVIETVAEGGTTTGSSLVGYIAFGIPKA